MKSLSNQSGSKKNTMIHGIGIDIVKIERMKNAVCRWDKKFLDRVFTENEILYAYKKRIPILLYL